MDPHVSRQVAPLARAVATMCACIRLLPTVYPQVRRQAALKARAVVTMRTCIRLLLTVYPKVRRQAALFVQTSVPMLANVNRHHKLFHRPTAAHVSPRGACSRSGVPNGLQCASHAVLTFSCRSQRIELTRSRVRVRASECFGRQFRSVEGNYSGAGGVEKWRSC